MTTENRLVGGSDRKRVIIVAGPEDADKLGKIFFIPDLIDFPHLAHDIPRSQQNWGEFPRIAQFCIEKERKEPGHEKYVLLGIFFRLEHIVCIVGPKEVRFSVPELPDFPKRSCYVTKEDSYAFLDTIESFIEELRKEEGKERYVPVAVLFDRSCATQESVE